MQTVIGSQEQRRDAERVEAEVVGPAVTPVSAPTESVPTTEVTAPAAPAPAPTQRVVRRRRALKLTLVGGVLVLLVAGSRALVERVRVLDADAQIAAVMLLLLVLCGVSVRHFLSRELD